MTASMEESRLRPSHALFIQSSACCLFGVEVGRAPRTVLLHAFRQFRSLSVEGWKRQRSSDGFRPKSQSNLLTGSITVFRLPI